MKMLIDVHIQVSACTIISIIQVIIIHPTSFAPETFFPGPVECAEVTEVVNDKLLD